jgi:hypothetical protein
MQMEQALGLESGAQRRQDGLIATRERDCREVWSVTQLVVEPNI